MGVILFLKAVKIICVSKKSLGSIRKSPKLAGHIRIIHGNRPRVGRPEFGFPCQGRARVEQGAGGQHVWKERRSGHRWLLRISRGHKWHLADCGLLQATWPESTYLPGPGA